MPRRQRHELVPLERTIQVPVGGERSQHQCQCCWLHLQCLTCVCASLFGSVRLCIVRNFVFQPTAKAAQGTVKGTPSPYLAACSIRSAASITTFPRRERRAFRHRARELSVLLLGLVAGPRVLNETDTVPTGNQRFAVSEFFVPRLVKQRDL